MLAASVLWAQIAAGPAIADVDADVDAVADADVDAVADDDVRRASSFVAGERVLLVSDVLDSPLALRTRDELESMGLFVVLRDDDDVFEVVSTARALGAAAAVEIHGGRLDLWGDLLVEHGRVAHAVIVSGDEPVDVVGLRAAELVRARILQPHERSSSTTTPTPPAPAIALAPATPMALEGSLGVQVLQLVGEVQPMVRAVLGGAVAVRQVVVGVAVAVPTVPANVVAAQGSAALQVTGLSGEVGWRFTPTETLHLTHMYVLVGRGSMVWGAARWAARPAAATWWWATRAWGCASSGRCRRRWCCG